MPHDECRDLEVVEVVEAEPVFDLPGAVRFVPRARENWLEDLVEVMRPRFASIGAPLPERIRVTCGFPSAGARRARNRAVGEHWSPMLSDDGTDEILISPVLDDALEVGAVLVHELVHAATPGAGHRGAFRRAAKAIGLEGRMTSTSAGPALRGLLAGAVDRFGPYPHARLNVAGRKKQTTRMLRAECPSCGYLVRLSATWAERGLPICSTCDVFFVA